MASIDINPIPYEKPTISEVTGSEKLLAINQNGIQTTIKVDKILDKVDKTIVDKINDKIQDSILEAPKVTWDTNSNMNDFKTPGVYSIYGERTRQDDNLPILNASSGHSIAARLTVVASTLQPANTEICVTQFLQLSNRVGGEGATYVRTYNENNNGMNGWSPWQKQMGMVETLINSNDATVGQEIFSSTAQKIGDGLNSMIDNGMYSGIYIDNLTYTGTQSLYYLSAQPTFVETFVLVVINDYAATGKLGMQRHITQLKYAVDAITGQSTVKKRVGTGNETISWSDWENINNIAIEEGEKRALRRLFIAAGAAYNDTDSIKEVNLEYDRDFGGTKVQHLPNHYRLNSLGDITEEEMIEIYNLGRFTKTEYSPLAYLTKVRTNLGRRGQANASGGETPYMAYSSNSLVTINLCTSEQYEGTFLTSGNAFSGCTNLRAIYGRLTFNAALTTAFTGCTALERVKIYNLKVNMLLNESPLISKRSVLYMIQNAAPTSAITITLHTDAYARLADDADIIAALEAQPLITIVSA